MQWVKAFAAGFLATLVFHQGLLAILYIAGVIPSPPYSWTPSEPLGVPAVLSLAFWGGVWGLPTWWLIRFKPTHLYWTVSLLFGAILPTVVAMLLIFPIKGIAVSEATWGVGLLLNAAWGLGVAVFMGPVFRSYPASKETVL